ncbi:hypothetical protein AAC387_Pa07g1151 [Persea americana]
MFSSLSNGYFPVLLWERGHVGPTVTCHRPLTHHICSQTHPSFTLSSTLSKATQSQSTPVSSPMEDPCKVQHVTRASSDELLHKFADLDSKSEHKSMEKKEAKERRRRKRARTEGDRGSGESPTKNGSLVEMKSLLQPRTRRSALLRQLGIGRQCLRIREIVISRSLLKKIEKAWHKTIEGASKMFMEKHCNQHMRLRNEAV